MLVSLCVTTVDTGAGNLDTRCEDIYDGTNITEAGNLIVDVGCTNGDRLLHAGRGALRSVHTVIAGGNDNVHPGPDSVADGVVESGGGAATERHREDRETTVSDGVLGCEGETGDDCAV